MSKGSETRERILDRAFRMAGQSGLAGLTIGALADELGVSKSGLWAHFGSKEELEVQILQVASRRFQEAVLKPALAAPRGEARLRKLFEGWLRWVTDPSMPGGCLFVAAAAELDDRQDSRARDTIVGLEKELALSLARIARGAIEQGQFRAEVDCDQLAFELHAIILGYSHSRRLLRDGGAEKKARAAFDRLLRDSRSTPMPM